MIVEFTKSEFDNTLCPLCGDVMTSTQSNFTPVWNEHADDITCWWCLHHHDKVK